MKVKDLSSIELKDWDKLSSNVWSDKNEKYANDWVSAIKSGERDTKWNRLMYSKKLNVLRSQTIIEWYSRHSQIGYGRD